MTAAQAFFFFAGLASICSLFFWVTMLRQESHTKQIDGLTKRIDRLEQTVGSDE